MKLSPQNDQPMSGGQENPAQSPTDHAGDQGKRFYLPELDTLRFVAFLAVFMCHAFPRPSAGGQYSGIPHQLSALIEGTLRAAAFGVDLFFMLSSFLITSLLVLEHQRTGKIDVIGFWIRRCLRIWPLYFTFVILAGLVLPLIFSFIPKVTTADIVGLFTFTYNWISAFYGVGAGSPTLILWSVSLEEQFYLTWPLLLVWAGISRLRTIAAGMIVFSILARLLVLALGGSSLMIWCATPWRLEPIAIGALLALGGNRLPQLTRITRIMLLGFGLAIPVLLSTYDLLPSRWNDGLKFPLIAVACLMILMAVLGTESKLFRLAPLVYLGKISYGLYVYHLLAIQFSPRLAIPGLPMGRTLAAFILTIGLAAASYHWLERPFLRLKDRFAHIHSRPV